VRVREYDASLRNELAVVVIRSARSSKLLMKKSCVEEKVIEICTHLKISSRMLRWFLLEHGV
jgi:hypothetical protein